MLYNCHFPLLCNCHLFSNPFEKKKLLCCVLLPKKRKSFDPYPRQFLTKIQSALRLLCVVTYQKTLRLLCNVIRNLHQSTVDMEATSTLVHSLLESPLRLPLPFPLPGVVSITNSPSRDKEATVWALADLQLQKHITNQWPSQYVQGIQREE